MQGIEWRIAIGPDRIDKQCARQTNKEKQTDSKPYEHSELLKENRQTFRLLSVFTTAKRGTQHLLRPSWIVSGFCSGLLIAQ
jgi:hypothetical protein